MPLALELRPRVLWVDDDAGVLRVIGKALERAGFALDSSLRGRDALARASAGLYDVIGLDLSLPDIDGERVLATLRSGGMDTPACILSAYLDDQSRAERAWRAGASVCLTKPLRSPATQRL